MGNNAAYTAFEATVIACHNKGVLDKALLTELIKPYSETDIDSGGKVGTLSRDGLEVEEVVLKVFGVKLPQKPKLPADYRNWNEEQHDQYREYHNKVYTKFRKIVEKFGW